MTDQRRVAIRFSMRSTRMRHAGSGAGFASTLGGKENADGLAAGFGVGFRRPSLELGFDYAYRNMGLLGGTNMLTFSVGW